MKSVMDLIPTILIMSIHIILIIDRSFKKTKYVVNGIMLHRLNTIPTDAPDFMNMNQLMLCTDPKQLPTFKFYGYQNGSVREILVLIAYARSKCSD